MAAFNPDEEIFSEEDLKNYFRVDLMYGTEGNQWPTRTILHFCVKLYPDCTEILERLKGKIPNSKLQTLSLKGKLMNIPGGKHAEEILLEHLESVFDPDDISKLSDMINAVSLTPSLPSKQDVAIDRIDLNLIMNYSPCNTIPNKCAEKIKAFKEKMEKKYIISINIIFGSFYKVYDDDSNGHIKGLSNLLNAGIELGLVWDLEHLIRTIEELEIVNEETRRDRQNVDIVYMQNVQYLARALDRAAQGEP
ncbi:hypothetical protein CHS0354_036303 [Potamilus streckersoni]|uniref:Activation-induced cytidine deaminase AID domain-containing protein n=1 Tax=Potamilus streckersoni TaxID=2493646 RepID=A0AAE0T8V8_9BIVA|nr:hypothetical protein CHS0354_036303 [Potamilus streckersoni]